MRSFKSKSKKETKSSDKTDQPLNSSKKSSKIQNAKHKNEKPPSLKLSPYLNQLHLYFEKSLLEDTEMDEAHHLSNFLLDNPEFYPGENRNIPDQKTPPKKETNSKEKNKSK